MSVVKDDDDRWFAICAKRLNEMSCLPNGVHIVIREKKGEVAFLLDKLGLEKFVIVKTCVSIEGRPCIYFPESSGNKRVYLSNIYML